MIDILTTLILSFITLISIVGLYCYTQIPITNSVFNLDSNPNQYILFRNNYLVVYFLVFASEWIQGPYIYRLYQSYGFSLSEIAQLFMVGFVSGATLGTWLGSLADFWGRKKICLMFCLLYTVHCLLLKVPCFGVLIVGRALAGVCTVLLFTIFEAWMVTEHFSQGFSEEDLRLTFFWSTLANGISAIFSGIASNLLVSQFGLWSPYLLTCGLLGLGFLTIIFTWKENYGALHSSSQLSLSKFKTLLKGIQAIFKDPIILMILLLQAFFEASMYVFVLIWPPALELTTSIELQFGLLFSCLVLSMMVGPLVIRGLDMTLQFRIEVSSIIFISIGSTALFVASKSMSFKFRFFSFNLFEVSVGMFYPIIASLRSRYIPDNLRSTILCLFRLPLNLLVIFLLQFVNCFSLNTILALCGGITIISLIPAVSLLIISSSSCTLYPSPGKLSPTTPLLS